MLEGPVALSADMERELALNRLAEARRPIEDLTPREFGILQMLLAQHSRDKIAESLRVSRKTVANLHDPSARYHPCDVMLAS